MVLRRKKTDNIPEVSGLKENLSKREMKELEDHEIRKLIEYFGFESLFAEDAGSGLAGFFPIINLALSFIVLMVLLFKL